MSSINYDVKQLELSDHGFREKEAGKEWYHTVIGQWIIQNCIQGEKERISEQI